MHSANSAAALGKSSRSAVMLAKRVNRPGPAVKLPADRVEILGDLPGGMFGGALVEHGADQRRPAGGFFVVGQRTAQHGHLHVDQRQIRVPFQQHAQAVVSVAADLISSFRAGRFLGRFRHRAGRENR